MKVLSDCWQVYSTLVDKGFVHKNVNSSIKCVSEARSHTNTIEGKWSTLKNSMHHYRTTKDLNNLYFAKYCIRKKFLADVTNSSNY